MTWTFTDDVDLFLAAVSRSLNARPAESTVMLTVTAALRRHGPRAYGDHDPVLGWWRGADGEVAGTLPHTPPYPATLNAVAPEAVAPLMAAHAADPCERGPGHRPGSGGALGGAPRRRGAASVPAGRADPALARSRWPGEGRDFGRP